MKSVGFPKFSGRREDWQMFVRRCKGLVQSKRPRVPEPEPGEGDNPKAQARSLAANRKAIAGQIAAKTADLAAFNEGVCIDFVEDALPETVPLNVAPDGGRIVMPDRPLYGTQPGAAYYAAQYSAGGDYSVTACAEGTPVEYCVNNLTWTEPARLYTPVLPAAGATAPTGLFKNVTGSFKVIRVRHTTGQKHAKGASRHTLVR